MRQLLISVEDGVGGPETVEVRDHRSNIRSKKRGGTVFAAPVHRDVLIGLTGAERIEQLADHHGGSGGRGLRKSAIS